MITVITVVYSALDDLKQTAESVFKQTVWPELEYIIVDGGSTDGTLEYLKTLPPSVRWISEPDKGIYDAMNKGIRMAKGDSIVMLNAGDFFLNDTVQRLQEFAENNSIDLSRTVIYGDAYYRFDGLNILRPGNAELMISEMSICHQATFVGCKVHEQFGDYSMEYRLAADYDFLLRVYLQAPQFFIHLPEPLVEFKYEGATSANYIRSLNETRQIARKYMSRSQYRKFLRRHYRSIILRRIEAFILAIWPGSKKPNLARLLYAVRSRLPRGIV